MRTGQDETYELPPRLRYIARRPRVGQIPHDAVIVTRPSKWGNPFKVGAPDPERPGAVLDRARAVELYERTLLAGELRVSVAGVRRQLAGRPLACACPLDDQPCHADVLRRVANSPVDIAVRTCRVCGCTDTDCSGCVAATGAPCSWVAADLCSACSPALGLLDLAGGLDAPADLVELAPMRCRSCGATPATPVGEHGLRFFTTHDQCHPCTVAERAGGTA